MLIEMQKRILVSRQEIDLHVFLPLLHAFLWSYKTRNTFFSSLSSESLVIS